MNGRVIIIFRVIISFLMLVIFYTRVHSVLTMEVRIARRSIFAVKRIIQGRRDTGKIGERKEEREKKYVLEKSFLAVWSICRERRFISSATSGKPDASAISGTPTISCTCTIPHYHWRLPGASFPASLGVPGLPGSASG